MIATLSKTPEMVKTTMDDMRKINDGFLKHEGLEVPEKDLKIAMDHCNGVTTHDEFIENIISTFGDAK